MSLIIALALSREAVIGADRRAIVFFSSCSALEEELYSGQIEDDSKLECRAKELRVALQISDGKEKVWRRGDILVGEVTEISARRSRRRRIYLLPGASLQADITCESGKYGQDGCDKADDGIARKGEARISARGRVGCTIFGNRFTQEMASQEIARAGGRVTESLIRTILEKAGRETASVSREHTVLRSDFKDADASLALFKALEEDCKENGWRLCDPH